MDWSFILGAILFFLIVVYYFFSNIKLRKSLQEKNKLSLATNEVNDALWENVHAYVLLITADFIIHKTNFYTVTGISPDIAPKRVGELFRCKNALEAGECGTHALCATCPIRHAITNSFKGKRNFADLEASLLLRTSESDDVVVDCEVCVSGTYMQMADREQMLLTVYDITKQKKDQEELNVARLHAEESNKLKSAFLANMSHEIRTPLSAIVGFSPLLATAETQEEKDFYVSIIEKNSELLLQLINDILDLSKIEAGTLEFFYSDVDVNNMMGDLEGVFKMKLSEIGSTVEIRSEYSLPSCFIHTDRNRVSQVISNFLSNAIKFTTEGSILLGYKVRETDICFYVADSGTGIPEEALESVFERFTKLDVKKSGTGLGLSICRMIVEKLAGRIGVQSELGKGSVFWFALPLKPLGTVKPELPMGIHVSDVSEKKSSKQNEKKTLLVAEDMEDNYLLYSALLAKKYNLIHAWNGEEAIALFLKHSPDAILMDLRMPEVDGYQATEAIRQMSSSVPVVAVTAFAFAEDKRKILSVGFTDYLSKPIQAESLYEKLKQIGV